MSTGMPIANIIKLGKRIRGKPPCHQAIRKLSTISPAKRIVPEYEEKCLRHPLWLVSEFKELYFTICNFFFRLIRP